MNRFRQYAHGSYCALQAGHGITIEFLRSHNIPREQGSPHSIGGLLGRPLLDDGYLVTPMIAADFGWAEGLYFGSLVVLIGMLTWLLIDPEKT